MMGSVQVVAGVLFHPNHPDWQFLGRRRSDPHRGAWEHPGGKVEIGETFQDALAREWQEEIGISVTVSALPVGWYSDPDGRVHVSLYRVHLSGPVPLDHALSRDGPAHDRFMFATLSQILEIPRDQRIPSLKTLARAADNLT